MKEFILRYVAVFQKKKYLFFFSLFLAILVSSLFWNYDVKKTFLGFCFFLVANWLMCDRAIEKNRFFKMHYQYKIAFYSILCISAFFSLALSSYLGIAYLSLFTGVALITILFGKKAGQASSLFLFIVFSLAYPAYWMFLLTNLFTGYITAELVNNVNRRIDLSLISFGISAIQIVFLLPLVWVGYERIGLQFFLPVAIVPVVSTILVIGILPYIEWISRIYSNIGLLELGNLNHKLLKELGSLAPGTYSHSTVLANLAEAAAEKIGVNPILARVGCYFHDIGKIKRPDYFVENQKDTNPHDQLTPNISHLVLADHVKTGIDYAKKYRLPLLFEDFIVQHHGTRVQKFFYLKSKDQNIQLDETHFRYPGPKPTFKEAGILMLADSCEAAVKSLGSTDAVKLRSFIKDTILGIFLERELDNSGLTLNDLEEIEEVFFKLFLSQQHKRISYAEASKGSLKTRERIN